MDETPKQQLIESFFEKFEQRIARLQELRQAFPDEAFTLCLVYIDRLSRLYFRSGPRENRAKFWRTLKQLSGNPLFGMIHPGRLRELTNEHCPSAAPFVDSIVGRQPKALLDEDALVTEIRKSALTEVQKFKLTNDIWRASLANIAYDYLRAADVRGPGSGGLTFDEPVYEGHTGVKLDFETFYTALREIFERVEKAHTRNGGLLRFLALKSANCA